MKTNKVIVITGTHHTPAIELIHQLKHDQKNNWQIHYLGNIYPSETHILHTIIPKLNVSFHHLDCGKFDRKNLDKTIIGIPKTVSAFVKASHLLSVIKPDIVVSFGGYVSVPVIFAAFVKNIPSISHEQTLTISLSTKINSYFATKVAVSFPHPKAVLTGNLIRHEIFNTNSQKFKNFKLKIKNFPVIYVTGGNQGSVFLNQLVYSIIPKLSSKLSIIHQTGKNSDPQTQKLLVAKYPHYHPFEFIEIEDIGWLLNKSDLIISRSGANICQEIAALDKKSLLIPHPFTQQNEQQKNADWLKSIHPHTTQVIHQTDVTAELIIKSINTLIKYQHTSYPQTISSPHPLIKLIHEITP